MTKEQKIEKLLELGGKRWTKTSMDRIYFNVNLSTLNITTSAYGECGEDDYIYVSKSYGKRLSDHLYGMKVFYDINAEKFVIQGGDISTNFSDHHVADFVASLESKLEVSEEVSEEVEKHESCEEDIMDEFNRNCRINIDNLKTRTNLTKDALYRLRVVKRLINSWEEGKMHQSLYNEMIEYIESYSN